MATENATADLNATADIIFTHGYDPEMLACACGFSCLSPHHAMHVARLIHGNDE